MKFSDVLFKPQGSHRPSKEQVIRYAKDVMKIDYDEFAARETLKFECANENVVIHGEYHSAKNARGCVIMAHGFAQNRYILIPQEQMFRRLGFSTVIFDQRAFGESKEGYCTFGMKEAEDVVRVINYVKESCGAHVPIILFGISMGAATVMNVLNYTDDIYCIIEDSGFVSLKSVVHSLSKSFGMDGFDERDIKELEKETEKLGFSVEDHSPLRAIRYKEVPICIIHGTADSVISVDHAKVLYGACTHQSSRMELFEDIEHALCVTDIQKYERVIRSFLKELL